MPPDFSKLPTVYNQLMSLDRVDLPEKLVNTRLKDHQTIAVAFHLLTNRSLINYNVGTGKTLCAIYAAMLLRDREDIKRVFIAAQPSQVGYWYEQFKLETYIRPNLIYGVRQSRQKKIADIPDNFVSISHYPAITRDIEDYLKFDYDFLILDEATVIKNRSAQITHAMKALAAKSKHVMLLTATPLQNNLAELFSLMECLDPKILGDYFDFVQRYCIESSFDIRRGGRVIRIRQITGIRTENIPELKEKIKFNCLTKSVNLDLPPIIFHDRWLDMSQAQQKKYDEVAEGVLVSGESLKYVDLLARFVYQLQICDSVSLVDPSVSEESPKIAEIRTLLKGEYSGEKIIIFSMFRKTIDLIEKVLKEDGIVYRRITGAENIRGREAVRKDFSNNPDIKVMLITTAAEMGLNLQSASVMIIVSRLYNPQRMKQIVGRIYRQGQANKRVMVINLLMRDTVESRVLSILKRKSEIYKAVFGKSNLPEQEKSKFLRELITGKATEVFETGESSSTI